MNSRPSKNVIGRLVEQTGKKSITKRRRNGAALNLQQLEDRRLMATLLWDGHLGAGANHWTDTVAGDTNWVVQGTATPAVPANNDSLIFPVLGVNKISVNDTPAGNTYSLTFQDSGYNISGNAITVGAGSISDTAPLSSNILANALNLNGSKTIDVTGSSHFLELDGPISSPGTATLTKTSAGGLVFNGTSINNNITTAINAGSATVNGSPTGPIIVNGGTATTNGSSTGSITLNTGGIALVNGSSTGSITVNAGAATLVGSSTGSVGIFAGSVQINGSSTGPVTLNNANSLLTGVGNTGPITSFAGTISPGFSPGIINSGTLILTPASTVVIELNGTVPGPGGYDQLNVTGNVNLGGAALNLTLGYTPAVGDSYTIVNNDGTDPIVGIFAGLPNSSVITLGGSRFTIRYDGGIGNNDVVITAIGPPIANPDIYALPENTGVPGNNGLTVPAFTGVLSNDTGTNIQAVLTSGPTHGTLSLNGDGSFTYIPAVNFHGTDSFMYKAADPNLQSQPTIVTLDVNAFNQGPVGNTDGYTVKENTTLDTTVPAIPGVLANDFSPQTPPLTLTAVAQVNPAHGTLALNPNGSFIYTPVANFSGTDSFIYRAVDSAGNSSNPVFVSLTVTFVDVAPVAVNDGSAIAPFTLNENTTLTVGAPGVVGNDINTGPGVLTSSLVTSPLHGTVTLNGDGSFAYTPVANYNGPDSFTYRVFDGTLFSTTNATVFLNVLPVAQTPIANNDSYTTQEDTSLSILAPGLLLNDLNPDGGTPTIIIVNNPQHGTLTPNPLVTGAFTYTPALHYTGLDSFTYYLRSAAGLNSNLATVSLTIQPVAHAPVGVADTYTVAEDKVLNIPAMGVLANDTNIDKDLLQANLITTPSNGTLLFASDGSFTYTPNLHFNGTDSFTYQPFNTSQVGNVTTVSLTVTFLNHAPVANPDVTTVVQSRTGAINSVTINVLANDTDVDNPALTPNAGLTISLANVTALPLHGTLAVVGNNFVYTPNLFYIGSDTFTYRASDGLALSNPAAVTISVTKVPVAVNDTFTVDQGQILNVGAPGLLGNDASSDPASPVSAYVIAAPTNGSLVLNSNGSFVYTPFANFFGTDSFTYQISDGLLFSNVATATLTVRQVPVAPVATNDAYTTTRAEKLTVTPPGVLGNDSDAAQNVAITAVLVQPTMHGSLTLNPDGSFVYTPVTNFVGVDTFTYRASDGTLTSNLATVTITVTDIAGTTVQLDPASDTGVSNSDRITNNNMPRFFGTAPSLLTVRLYATPQGSSAAPVQVGMTTADIAGNYSIITSTLPDGVYNITAASFYPDGLSTGVVTSGGSITIDTVAPVVQSAILNLRTGQISITFFDERSGLDQGSIGNKQNYNAGVVHIFAAAPILVREARALPTTSPSGSQTVLLDISGGAKLQSRTYVFGILSGGVRDVAGNALAGNFTGLYPTGQGSNRAGDFHAQFNPTSQVYANAVPTTFIVPILPPSSGNNGAINTVVVGSKSSSRHHHHSSSTLAPVSTKAAHTKLAKVAHTVPSGPVGKSSLHLKKTGK